MTVFLLWLLSARGGGAPVSNGSFEDGWVVVDTDRIRFHFPPSAPISHDQRAYTIAKLLEFEQILGATVPKKIDYFRYESNERKRELTGQSGNAHVSNDHTLHTVWPVDNHEIVHLIAFVWGRTDSSLLGEGIAVHLSGSWLRRPIDSWIPEYEKEGRLPSLASLASSRTFARMDAGVTYAVAGSFVGYLVRTYGIDAFRSIYSGPGSLDARCKKYLHKSLAQLEQDWLAQVDS
jgi:hypothetical protein